MEPLPAARQLKSGAPDADSAAAHAPGSPAGSWGEAERRDVELAGGTRGDPEAPPRQAGLPRQGPPHHCASSPRAAPQPAGQRPRLRAPGGGAACCGGGLDRHSAPCPRGAALQAGHEYRQGPDPEPPGPGRPPPPQGFPAWLLHSPERSRNFTRGRSRFHHGPRSPLKRTQSSERRPWLPPSRWDLSCSPKGAPANYLPPRGKAPEGGPCFWDLCLSHLDGSTQQELNKCLDLRPSSGPQRQQQILRPPDSGAGGDGVSGLEPGGAACSPQARQSPTSHGAGSFRVRVIFTAASSRKGRALPGLGAASPPSARGIRRAEAGFKSGSPGAQVGSFPAARPEAPGAPTPSSLRRPPGPPRRPPSGGPRGPHAVLPPGAPGTPTPSSLRGPRSLSEGPAQDQEGREALVSPAQIPPSVPTPDQGNPTPRAAV
ncbi:basic salivary proline-rich protein 2-like [Antechinus flavipes]|uniref:basic salivary proline-rich protein 2-like n=1 Tax=Antechinus flavipes TaxID=38775 RepID=UPI0022355B74|nr:basic salivary proline-rich protein 2-like [Antechinus flavipes]